MQWRILDDVKATFDVVESHLEYRGVLCLTLDAVRAHPWGLSLNAIVSHPGTVEPRGDVD